MTYNKNDKIELDIIDITKDGLGLAKNDKKVYFVKDGVVGDKVLATITKITQNINYAKVIEVLEKSVYRVDKLCDNANNCGGCQTLNIDYAKQLDIKKRFVINTLRNIGNFNIVDIDNRNNITKGNPKYLGIYGMDEPSCFRNKMQVPYCIRDGKIIYGFYAGRTHHIVEFNKCYVGFKGAEIILDVIKDALIKYNISIYDEKNGAGVFREVMLRCGNTSNEISITYIINDKQYEKHLNIYNEFDEYIRNEVKLRQKIDINDNRNEDVKQNNINLNNIVTSTININTNNNNVLFGNKNVILYGNGFIEDMIGAVKYRISPESFYQVNNKMTKVLYDKVLAFADFNGDEKVLDLYCGIGTISLYIARYVSHVLGIEVVDRAIVDAKNNAGLNGIENASFICSDIDEIIDIVLDDEKARKEHNKTTQFDDVIINSFQNKVFDTIIVDPPRKGLSAKTIDLIKKLSPEKIIYVSCDPATLARDLGTLCHSVQSYNLVEIANVDMFPHTMHVETIAKITKCKNISYSK